MTAEPDWRDDPAWKLAAVDRDYWKAKGETPPEKPPAEAELAQPDSWASLYHGRSLVATWSRVR